jgi:AcrR family transcriptional regulator
MARRREQQKRDRERRILRSAARRFGTKGYAGTAMEDVAASANLAVGTLYNYFRSKSELLLAILRRETEDLLAAGQQVVDEPPDDPADAIAALTETYLRVFEHHGRRLWRDLFAAAIADPSAIGAAAFEADLRLIAQLSVLLEKLQAHRLIGTHVEPGRAAITIYSIYFTWFSVFLVSEDMTIERLREEIRRGTEIAIHGLLPPAKRRGARAARPGAERAAAAPRGGKKRA